MSVQLAAQDFTTPDKGGPTYSSNNEMASTFASAAAATTAEASKDTSTTSTNSNTVTPHNAPAASTGGKHVRFGAEDVEKADVKTESPDNGSSSSKRGVVSQRGRRCVTPGRSVAVTTSAAPTSTLAPKEASVLKYSNFDEDKGSVPALCTANSVGLVSLPSECEKEKDSTEDNVKSKLEEFEGNGRSGGAAGGTPGRPSSISCASTIGPTSPLARSSPPKDSNSFEIRSPVPSTPAERFKKTPTKSPSHFQSLPSLDDPKLGSPVGFMLSPGPGTPSYKSLRDSFEKEGKDDKHDDNESLGDEKIRDYSKDKFALTPTNFSTDYGRSSGSTFDTSNVLHWLQSPTANGLFSPGGGLNSIMNTPKGPLVPRTPGTPTVSTSFFFSDVAGLARNGDTPKRGDGETGKSPKKGLSNIICISPLASSRHRGAGNATKSPMNYNDIFASPNPLLEDSPAKRLMKRNGQYKKGPGGPGYDALTDAERELMQDEDLSVLLQLAGGNTPKALADRSAKNSPSGRVFRASGRSGDDPNDRENSRLQLPIIGDGGGDSSAARLSRKSHSGEGDGFKPSIGIRKSASAHENEIFAPKEVTSSNRDMAHPGKPVGSGEMEPNRMNNEDARKPAASHPGYHHRPYPPRPPSDVYGYPAFPPNGMRPSGRMSVIVGGPPPSSRTAKPSSAPRGPMQAHRRPPYSHPDYPPPGMYPPPGHYPPHPVHMSQMGGHPYPAHYHGAPAPPRPQRPPPSHMPMYGAQHHHPAPVAAKASPKTTTKAKLPKAVGRPALPPKRPSIASSPAEKPAKKPKKSPASKKKKSPQLTEKADRQKAAQTIAAVNAASGGKNDKAAALAAAILRGVTMRPSGKWQAQLYFAGKSRYIGVFDTREKAALAYEIAREKLKSEKQAVEGALTPKQTENAVNAARKAAFDGVNEKDPRVTG